MEANAMNEILFALPAFTGLLETNAQARQQQLRAASGRKRCCGLGGILKERRRRRIRAFLHRS